MFDNGAKQTLGISEALRSGSSRRPWAPPVISTQLTAIIALVAANLIWGTTFVVTKPLLDHVPPLTLATSRFVIALLVLLPVLARTGRRPILNRKTAVMGFSGVFVVYFCQNLGLQYTSASNGALIHGGIPVFTALFAGVVLGERLGTRQLIGLGLAVFGVTVVVLFGGGQLAVSVMGDGLVLLSAFGLAAYFVLGRRAFPGGSSLELVAGVAVWGLLFLLPASGIEIGVVGVARPTVGDVFGLLYLGAAASALAFMLWAHGLRHMEAGQASVFANLNPLVGVAVAAALLGDHFGPAQIVGGLLTLAGVWFVTRRQRGANQMTRVRATTSMLLPPDALPEVNERFESADRDCISTNGAPVEAVA